MSESIKYIKCSNLPSVLWLLLYHSPMSDQSCEIAFTKQSLCQLIWARTLTGTITNFSKSYPHPNIIVCCSIQNLQRWPHVTGWRLALSEVPRQTSRRAIHDPTFYFLCIISPVLCTWLNFILYTVWAKRAWDLQAYVGTDTWYVLCTALRQRTTAHYLNLSQFFTLC